MSQINFNVNNSFRANVSVKKSLESSRQAFEHINLDNVASDADFLLAELNHAAERGKEMLSEYLGSEVNSEEHALEIINFVPQALSALGVAQAESVDVSPELVKLCSESLQIAADNGVVNKDLVNSVLMELVSEANDNPAGKKQITNMSILYLLLCIATVDAGAKMISLNTSKIKDFQMIMEKLQSLLLMGAVLSARLASAWQLKQLAAAKAGTNSDGTNTMDFNEVANSKTHGLTQEDGVEVHQELDLSTLLNENIGFWDGSRLQHNPLVMALVRAELITLPSNNYDGLFRRRSAGAFKLTEKGNSLMPDKKLDLFKLPLEVRREIIAGVEGNKALDSKSNGVKWVSVDGKAYETSSYDADNIALGDVVYVLPELLDSNKQRVDLTGKFIVNAKSMPADFPVYSAVNPNNPNEQVYYAAISKETLTNYIKGVVKDFCRITGTDPEDLKDSFISSFLGSVAQITQAETTIQNKLNVLQQSIQSLEEQIKGLKSNIDACNEFLERGDNKRDLH